MVDMFEVAERLVRANNELERRGYKVWSVNLYGAQNYRMETPQSDLDFKAVVLPTLEDIVSGKDPVSTTIGFMDGQIDIKDVRCMFKNYEKMNTNFLETLFTDYYVVKSQYTDEWNELRSLAEEIAYADGKRALHAFLGMAKQKQHALCHPFESKKEVLDKFGYDPKQLCHILRLHYMMSRYVMGIPYADLLKLNTAQDSQVEHLKKIKTGEVYFPIEEAKASADEHVKQMEQIVEEWQDSFEFNQEPFDKMNEIKARIIKRELKNELLADMKGY